MLVRIQQTNEILKKKYNIYVRISYFSAIFLSGMKWIKKQEPLLDEKRM